MLAGVRVLDAVLRLGEPLPGQREGGSVPSANPETYRTSFSKRWDVVTYALLDPGSTLTQFLGTSLADSPLT